MKVLKFGGTSVGQPDRMSKVASIVTSDREKKIVVLSALSGTTNTLINIGDHLSLGEKDSARTLIEELYLHYQQFYDELFTDEDYRQKVAEIIDGHFGFMWSLLEKPYSSSYNNELLAQGELMSTKMFHQYLEASGVQAELIPALDFMAIDEYEEPDIPYIRKKLSKIIDKHEGVDLFITQGYICLNSLHEIDNLKRGGSDYTATLIGAAINAGVVQIWTDIDGMHNNDPREVEKTYPVAELSFNEASELAYFGAKILHPSSILPVTHYNIPVQLKNTMDPEAHGTLISSEEKTKEIKAIAAKDGITAIKIKSTRMLMAYGFMRRIFEIFEKYKTPIDMITTSEVAVSLTIDNDAYLENILEELNVFGEVSADKSQTIVCIVGNLIAEEKGLITKVFDALERIPIRMISYGGSRYNVSVLVDSKYKKDTLQALNKGLFELC